MFDIATIKTIAVSTSDSLVGWVQSTLSGAVTVSTKLKTSRSGLYFERGSALATVENVRNSMEDPNATDDEVNTFLESLTGEAFTEVCSSIFNSEDYLGGGLLYKHESDKTLTTLPDNSFVGYEIDVNNANDFASIITRIMLRFNGDESIKILCFNSQKKDPIFSETISALADDTTEKEVNWKLSKYQNGGKFYIGYLTAGLTAQPYARNYQAASLPTYFADVAINPIKVAHTAETMFDPNDIVYTESSTSYGINLDIQGYADYTQVIKTNQRRMARALQLAVAVKVADLILNSVRSNGNEQMNKAAIVFELNGNVNNQKMPEKIGLYKLLALEEDKVRRAFFPTGITKGTLR